MTYKRVQHNTDYFPADFKFKWPTADEKLAGDIPTLKDLDDHVFPAIQHKGVAVQAGGAMGLWSKRMSQEFDAVYTFEPHPQSFHCLVCNVPEENVVKINAALGNERRMVHMEPERPGNYGANQVYAGGIVPTLRIDDLGLERCDLIMLDIEGFELFALEGAAETIGNFRPVIVLEDKGCSRKYGYQRGECENYLKRTFKYKEFTRFHGGRDVLCR